MTRAKDISKIVTDANLSGTLDVTGAFTSQGIDDNANATAITIDSSENVGIGTSSPTSQNGKVLHGLKEGEWKGFYDNGNLLWSGFYNKGLNISKWIEYHKNGKVFTMGHYENGKKIGVWLFYDEQGEKIAEEIFHNGSVTTKIYK